MADSLEQRTVQKRQALMSMLEQGMTMVHLDARAEDVCVPETHKDDGHLRLNFSYRFQLEVFEIGEEEVLASLSFNGTPFPCVIPWTSIFAMTSHVTGEFRVWQEDLPQEMLEEMAEAMRAQRAAEAEASGEAAQEADGEELEEGGAVRRVRHLRVIK